MNNMKNKTTTKKNNKRSPKVLSPLRVGNCVFIRTVTAYQLGRIESIGAHEIVLSSASWVACTKRFASETLDSGQLDEVEAPRGGVCAVGRGAIVDVWDWNHDLPKVTQ